MSASRKEKEAEKVHAESEVKRPERRLNAGELRKYKERILRQKDQALYEAEGRVHCQGLLSESIDRANAEDFGRVDDRRRDRARRLLVKIKEVLQIFDEGEYGICTECGEQIPRKRLDSRPVTTKCWYCKTESDIEDAKKEGKPIPRIPLRYQGHWQEV